jgi:hypothetical protein
MQWAAASSETRPQRPHCIWTPESNEISDQLMQKFNAAKEILQKEVDRQREQSQIEGTPEQLYLAKLNDQVNTENSRRRAQGVRGRLQQYTAERAFKYEALSRDHKKGGLDFV